MESTREEELRAGPPLPGGRRSRHAGTTPMSCSVANPVLLLRVKVRFDYSDSGAASCHTSPLKIKAKNTFLLSGWEHMQF